MRQLCVLGATGSIGQSTLALVTQHPDRFTVHALSAYSQVDKLIALCVQFQPKFACIADEAGFSQLQSGLQAAKLKTEALAGTDALDFLAGHPDNDTVVAGIVGAAGVASTIAAAKAGKRILLANKESVVVAGDLLMTAVSANQAELFPIDSEHNAIFQCLPQSAYRSSVRRLILTASGGPFLGKRAEQLQRITPEQACKHPNWSMGRKISVDSATLMNKGLEVIEAHYLFAMPAERIEVVIHPQSIVHSMVDYCDGSVLAQMGHPDMRTAIAYGLAYPERMDSGVPALDLCSLGAFQFQAPDTLNFPCLRLAYDALRAGGSAPCVLNAANEVAVALFLQNQLPFLGIAELVERSLSKLDWEPAEDLSVLMSIDAQTRIRTQELAQQMITQ